VNLLHEPLGGVEVEDGFSAGSLILSPPTFLPMTLGFFRGGRVATTFCLPARVLDDLTLGPANESSVDSKPGARAKSRTTRIRSLFLKPEMVEAKLSKVCMIAYAKNEYSKRNLKASEILPYTSLSTLRWSAQTCSGVGQLLVLLNMSCRSFNTSTPR
jgi:hypothetical protein